MLKDGIDSVSWNEGSVHVPNYESFLVTEVERKHVRGRARFQQHRDPSSHHVFFSCKARHQRNFTPFWQRHYVNMRHRMPPSKTCWPRLNVAISTCDAPRPRGLKTVTTPEIIEQIHELIFEDRRISAKSIGEQPGISHERVVSIINEDVVMRKHSGKLIPKCLNAERKRQPFRSSEQHLDFFFCRRDSNDFLSRLVTMDVTWLYHYDLETKQQSMEWRHSGSPRRKYYECKIRWKSSRLDFLRWRRHPPDLPCKESNYQRGVILISAGAFERHFEGKAPREVYQGELDFARQHRLTGHLQSRRNWPTWTSNVLISHPNLRIWPRRTTTCPVNWKNPWKVTIFLPTRNSLLPRDLLVGQISDFFLVTCRS